MYKTSQWSQGPENQPSQQPTGPIPPPLPAVGQGFLHKWQDPSIPLPVQPQPAPQAPSSPPPLPFPLLLYGAPVLNGRNVEQHEVTLEAIACLRASTSEARRDVIIKRVRDGAQMPPILLFQRPDKTLVLIDGIQRLGAFRYLGIKVFPANVINTCLADALVVGIHLNKKKKDLIRSDSDAVHSLQILATALCRPVTEPEALSMGVRWVENAPIPKHLWGSLHLPSFPIPETQPHKKPRVAARSVTTKLKRPKTGK